ncbi:MAG: triose-phosphate isomerase [Candidatus Margulisiibacteriota bacterium]
MRKLVVAGNWKMVKTCAETEAFASAFSQKINRSFSVETIVFPPFTSLSAARKALPNMVKLGGQNLYPAIEGAFTGEISPGMLVELGCSHVLIGHSERRQYFHEDPAFLARKLEAAFTAGLCPVLCIGETLEQYEAGTTQAVLASQLKQSLEPIKAACLANPFIIAYEPVWAIGTGKVATAEYAQEVHAFVRKVLADCLSSTLAETIQILYGGSVKPNNAVELLSQPDIDGALIGGASLDPDSFFDIIVGAHDLKK